MYRALRAATVAVALRELNFEELGAFRIVHISIQRTHVHLIVEADTKEALSKGLQSFQISAAKHINREYSKQAGLERRRRGNVFTDRFHQEHLTSPRQARNTLAYVLRGSIKTSVDAGSGSGDHRLCLYRPRTALAHLAVENVGIRSPDSRSTVAANSTA